MTVSVSGSSATGHCLNITITGVTSTCTDPTSSILFDGVIPTLTGLDGDMWASQLLTFQRVTATHTLVLFDFSGTQGYVGLSGRLEVVMFNCPEKGISASTIRVSTSSSPSMNPTPLMDVNTGITSCDSLVTVCTPISTIQKSITLDFFTGTNMVYLAEVTFYAANSSSTCPPDTIITTAPPDTITPPTTALEVPQTVSLTTPVPDSTFPEDNTTPTGTSATIHTIEGSTNTAAPTGSNTVTSVIIPVVVLICVVFMIVGIMAAVLILWRYHKHKTSHHTALGEGHSHAHTHSHPPPVKMCEETGQVCYSSPPEALGQLSPSHDTYSHLQQDASEGRGGAQSHQGGSNEGEYSTLSHGNSPHVLGGGGEDSASQLYAQVDKKPMKKRKKKSTLVTYSDEERSAVNTLELEASTHLYDRVDAKKKDNDIPTHSHTPEAGTTDQLYAQVDKKNKKRKKGEVATHSHTSEAGTTDQLYAQVDKKKVKKKKGEVTTHSHTPEADTPMDQLYAQVDKKKKQKNCKVTIHPDADTAVDQLYAQVDKKKKKSM